MRVYKCDRCGKYVAIEAKYFFVRKPTPLWRIGRKVHICDDCMKSFRRWFNDPKVKEESNDTIRDSDDNPDASISHLRSNAYVPASGCDIPDNRGQG